MYINPNIPYSIIFYVFSMPNIGIHVHVHGMVRPDPARHVLNQQRTKIRVPSKMKTYFSNSVCWQFYDIAHLRIHGAKISFAFAATKSTTIQPIQHREWTRERAFYIWNAKNPLALYIKPCSVVPPKTKRTTKCINEFMAYKMLSVLIDDNF